MKVELSVLNIENLIHSFVQNLILQVSPVCNKKIDKINFISYIDNIYHTNLELLKIGEESKDIVMRNNLDITDAQNMCHFIRKQTKFLDKFVYSGSISLLARHFNNINKKILQEIKGVNKRNINIAEHKVKYYQNKCSNLGLVTVQSDEQVYNRDMFEKALLLQKKQEDLSVMKKVCTVNCDLTTNIINYTRQEAKLNEKYLQLCINIEDFMKNVYITLHIDNKILYETKNLASSPCLEDNETNLFHKHALMLCKHAILCFIDPSEKVFVCVENDLPAIIQDYLSQGYKHHFNVANNVSIDHYSVLLILSKWARLLVKHPDATILRAISAILKCSICDILVLTRRSD